MRQEYLDAIARVAFSVSVVTTGGRAGREGITVTAMASISLDADGLTLLVSLHRDSRTTRAVLDNGVFCVNILADHQLPLAETFAGRGELSRDACFGQGGWAALATGAPALDGAVASFDCRLRVSMPVREHMILLGDVEATRTSDATPLVHWRRAYRGLNGSAGGR